jgi:hypothetical protein
VLAIVVGEHRLEEAAELHPDLLALALAPDAPDRRSALRRVAALVPPGRHLAAPRDDPPG